MNRFFSLMQKIKSFLQSHKIMRIVLFAAALLLALSVLLHPRGTKTFLVLGMDNYGSLDESGRSDVTMLVQVSFTDERISAVTFARDMFIGNENGKLTKINTIIRGGDEQALCDAITRNFGVPIDGWFRLNFTSVIELVDAIGGAQVELTKAEASYIDKTAGKYPQNPLSEGLCQLNGAQALTYARCRKLDNDFGRGDRQSKLLAAMVAQTKRMTASNIADVFRSLKHAWRSSLSISEQAGLIFKALWLRGADVARISMPFEGHWHYGSAGSAGGVVADLEENRLLLLEALGLPHSPTATPAE